MVSRQHVTAAIVAAEGGGGQGLVITRKMMIMRIVIALVLTGLLVGCVTTAERAAQIQREVEEMILVYGPASAIETLRRRLVHHPGGPADRIRASA